MQHMQQTLQLGMVALETSRIAQQKAQNANLKQLATFEVQEQTTISEVLHSMMDPSATAATSAQATGTEGATGGAAGMQMPTEARQMVQKLQSAQAGAEFDREYLKQGQIQGHRDLLQVQERYLSSNPQNREHMNVAKMARTQIREHIPRCSRTCSRRSADLRTGGACRNAPLSAASVVFVPHCSVRFQSFDRET